MTQLLGFIAIVILITICSASLATSFVFWDWQWFWETNAGWRLALLLALGGVAAR